MISLLSMRSRLIIFICILSFFSGPLSRGQTLKLSTQSDSAAFYYRSGWRSIMDDGMYTLSEVHFRQSVAHDPSFLLAQCQVARLSKSEEERNEILALVRKNLKSVSKDEQLLLDNFIELIILTNLREAQDTAALKIQAKKALTLAEQNLREFSSSYPDEVYHNCEFIEVINYLYGPKAAIDTLEGMKNGLLNHNTFMIGYKAHLLAQIKEFDQATDLVDQLKNRVNSTLPKPHVVEGLIAEEKGEVKTALASAQNALRIDPGNIDAQRLEARMLRLSTN